MAYLIIFVSYIVFAVSYIAVGKLFSVGLNAFEYSSDRQKHDHFIAYWIPQKMEP